MLAICIKSRLLSPTGSNTHSFVQDTPNNLTHCLKTKIYGISFFGLLFQPIEQTIDVSLSFLAFFYLPFKTVLPYIFARVGMRACLTAVVMSVDCTTPSVAFVRMPR